MAVLWCNGNFFLELYIVAMIVLRAPLQKRKQEVLNDFSQGKTPQNSNKKYEITNTQQ